MTIPVISEIVPQNDNQFFGVTDDESVTGGFRSVADLTARDAIYNGRRKDGMRVWVRSEQKVYQLLGGITNSHWVESADGGTLSDVVYQVDPVAGDDDADGITNPWQTLLRASKAPDGMNVKIQLLAGTHDLHTPSDLTGDSGVLTFGSHRQGTLVIEGVTTSVETFKTLSQVGNVITKDGSTSDWTPSEHVGRRLKVTFWGTVDYWFYIVENTATTMVVVYSPTDIGGYYPTIPVGTDLEIHTNDTKIGPAPSNAGYDPCLLYVQGSVRFKDILFDGESQGSWMVKSWSFCDYRFTQCTFKNINRAVELFGNGMYSSCAFVNCADHGIAPQGGNVDIYDTHFENGATGATGCVSGLMRVGNNTLISAKDMTQLWWMPQFGELYDYGAINRLDNVDTFCQLYGPSVYKHDSYIKAVSGYGALNNYGFNLTWGGNKVDVGSAASAEITAGSSFFRVNGENLPLTDFLAISDHDAVFPKDNRIFD